MWFWFLFCFNSFIHLFIVIVHAHMCAYYLFCVCMTERWGQRTNLLSCGFQVIGLGHKHLDSVGLPASPGFFVLFCFLCLCVYMYTCMSVHMYAEARCWCWVSFSITPFFFETELLSKSGGYRFRKNGWAADAAVGPSHWLPVLGLHVHTIVPSFLHWCWKSPLRSWCFAWQAPYQMTHFPRPCFCLSQDLSKSGFLSLW